MLYKNGFAASILFIMLLLTSANQDSIGAHFEFSFHCVLIEFKQVE